MSFEQVQQKLFEHNDQECARFWNSIVTVALNDGHISKERAKELQDKRSRHNTEQSDYKGGRE